VYVILVFSSGPNEVNSIDKHVNIILDTCVQYCNLAFIHDGLEVLIKYNYYTL